MNTRQVECALELAKTLDFREAAERLYVSQPTLSYQVKALEDEIGFKIFERSGRGAALTPAGEQFCVTLRSVQEELEEAVEQGQNFSARFADDIRVCLPVRSAPRCLPAVMSRMRAPP